MKIKNFFDAMSEIDDKYICEAIEYSLAKKRKQMSFEWIRCGAIIACLCVVSVVGIFIKSSVPNVVTSSGFLTITACAVESDEELTMQEGMELPLDYYWSPAMSSRPGFPLKLVTAEHPNATFEVSAEGGSLVLWEDNEITYEKSPLNVENGMTIYWTNLSQTRENDFKEYKKNKAYINIVIWEQENIIGFAVVQIFRDDIEKIYYAKLIESISFPKVNGKYQRITPEYIVLETERVKSKQM